MEIYVRALATLPAMWIRYPRPVSNLAVAMPASRSLWFVNSSTKRQTSPAGAAGLSRGRFLFSHRLKVIGASSGMLRSTAKPVTFLIISAVSLLAAKKLKMPGIKEKRPEIFGSEAIRRVRNDGGCTSL
ncbi:MAG: hypothetical protein BWY89_02014 [Bacteroidetes bacterium ADurb.BinA012]|nr:MAG: hypothetical protein BWY89_02014 [Bacteroidetes bacterium ADurb.BinA012]